MKVGVNPYRGRLRVLSTGQFSSMRISMADTTTIVLSEPNQDLGIFAEENFWTIFGGRKITLTAIGP